MLPTGDPDGGSVSGGLTTNLMPADTVGGHLYMGAWEPDGGLLVGADLGMVTFPYVYRIDDVPAGQRVIRALLDLPPYAARPLLEPAGSEDATGVYLNASSVFPINVRPGVLTTGVDFFVTRNR
ncbi:MAG TPA: hypothetical protein VKN99_02025 [Polyangia bacterium]|nr:hypothetical protein [Polyangia bacterium]